MAEDLPNLTPKQHAFVKHLLEGKTASDAYRLAYDTSKTKDHVIWVRASELKADSKVQVWLTQAKQHALTERSYGLTQHLEDLEEARRLAKDTGNIGAYVKATELLGRASGVYVERIQTEASEQDMAKILETLGQPGRDLARDLGIDLPQETSEGQTKH